MRKRAKKKKVRKMDRERHRFAAAAPIRAVLPALSVLLGLIGVSDLLRFVRLVSFYAYWVYN